MSLYLRLIFFSLIFLVGYLRWSYHLILTLPLKTSTINLDMSIILDKISLIGVTLVLLISGCVFLFSYKYMREDHNEARFALILGGFVASILLLLLGNSITFILIGWDGLGITSFLLIIYYDRKTNNRSGLITFIVNRFGDAMLIGNAVYFISYGHVDLGIYLGLFITVIYIVVAITKRAQYPFSIWLPLAIDAPTPVSALVHRRTLVTAGLFFLARIIPENLNLYLRFIGGITLCVGGICAIFSSDLKKLIANSTLSNLGLIIIILSIRNKDLIIFHLFTHALFKAGLFILAGRILMQCFGAQDGRVVFSSLRNSPLLSSFIRAFFLSSRGIFFIRTFYSKHHIVIISQADGNNLIRFLLIFLGVILSTLYRLRFAFMIVRNFKGSRAISRSVPTEVKFSIIILGACSIVFGNRYNIRILYSIFSYEVPLLVIILLRLVIFLNLINKINRVLYSSILFIDSLIDVINFKNSSILAKVYSLDYGFGRLETRNYVNIIKINLAGLTRISRVNTSLVLIFITTLLLFI